MKIRILTVGGKMPGWVTQGCQEYLKRMPRDLPIDMIEIPLGNRGKKGDARKALQQESDAMLAAIPDKHHVVALEVKGRAWSTEQLAQQLDTWQLNAAPVDILIGGPDGLSDACRQRANQQWSLSNLTLPHPIVRVLLAEQLYRAWTVNQHHPYHRA